MWEMIKRLFCRHKYCKVDYLGTRQFPSGFIGRYLMQCHKCGKKNTQYGYPMYPFLYAPESEYDKSYHELKEEIRKTEIEIERLINLRGNLEDIDRVEQAIRRNWRHVETCKMWMNHACEYEYRDKYREFFE